MVTLQQPRGQKRSPLLNEYNSVSVSTDLKFSSLWMTAILILPRTNCSARRYCCVAPALSRGGGDTKRNERFIWSDCCCLNLLDLD